MQSSSGSRMLQAAETSEGGGELPRIHSPPPAAVVHGPCAGERRHQEDAGGFHSQQQSQTPHRGFLSNILDGKFKLYIFPLLRILIDYLLNCIKAQTLTVEMVLIDLNGSWVEAGCWMMWSVQAGCCCCPLYSVSLSDALRDAMNAWDSPEDLIPSVTDRQHILLLLSATRGIKKGFAALISFCFFFSFPRCLFNGIGGRDS